MLPREGGVPRSRSVAGLFWVGLLVVANHVVDGGGSAHEHETGARDGGQRSDTCAPATASAGGEPSLWDSHSFCVPADRRGWGEQEESGAGNATHGRLREYRISMPLSVEEFTRGRDFTVARINELEVDGKGERNVKVRNSARSCRAVRSLRTCTPAPP